MPYLWHIAPKSQNKEKKYPNKLPKTYGMNEEGQGQPDSDAEELYLCKFKVEGKPHGRPCWKSSTVLRTYTDEPMQTTPTSRPIRKSDTPARLPLDTDFVGTGFNYQIDKAVPTAC